MKSSLLLSILCVIALVSCKKDEPVTPAETDYSYLIEGSWSETYRTVVLSTDTSVTGDTTQNPKGKLRQVFSGGTITYSDGGKPTSTKKYTFDGSKLVIFISSPQEGNSETYTTTFAGNILYLNRKRPTSNGIIDYTEETNIRLEKY